MGSNQSKEVEKNVQVNRNSPTASTGRAILSVGTNIQDDKVETRKACGCSVIAASKTMAKTGSLIRQQTHITARSTKPAKRGKHDISNNSNNIRLDKKQKKQNKNENVNITVSNSISEVSALSVSYQDVATSFPYQDRYSAQNDKTSLADSTEICNHERMEGRDHSYDVTVQESCKLQRSETCIVTTESGDSAFQGFGKSGLTNNISKRGTMFPAPNLFVESWFPSYQAASYSTSTETSSLNRIYNRSPNVLDAHATVLNNFPPKTPLSMSGQCRPGSATVDMSITQDTVNTLADISHTGNICKTNSFGHTSLQSGVSSNTPVSAIQASPSFNSRLSDHYLGFTTSNSFSSSTNGLVISQRCNIEANTHRFPNWNELEVAVEVDSPEETIEHHQLTTDRMIANQVREYFSYSNNSINTSVSAHKKDSIALADEYITIRNTDGDKSAQISAKTVKLMQSFGHDELTDENMGIIIERPKHPRYATLASRILSFQNWPTTNSMSSETLAEAGFVYTGMWREMLRLTCRIVAY